MLILFYILLLSLLRWEYSGQAHELKITHGIEKAEYKIKNF